jgi:extracellular elastinolytic metalloproteinase
LAHGLSNRLTGGAANPNCLSQPEGTSLGEGWSDIIAVVLEQTPQDVRLTPKLLGTYVTGGTGFRKFPYSTLIALNPTTYSFGKKSSEVHDVGEIWASMLFEVYWNMVDRLGFDASFQTNPEGPQGNNKFLSLVVMGMKLQPCFPTFITARDLILLADRILYLGLGYKGENSCDIVKGFAKRGLGINAKPGFVDDFTISDLCK